MHTHTHTPKNVVLCCSTDFCFALLIYHLRGCKIFVAEFVWNRPHSPPPPTQNVYDGCKNWIALARKKKTNKSQYLSLIYSFPTAIPFPVCIDSYVRRWDGVRLWIGCCSGLWLSFLDAITSATCSNCRTMYCTTCHFKLDSTKFPFCLIRNKCICWISFAIQRHAHITSGVSIHQMVYIALSTVNYPT